MSRQSPFERLSAADASNVVMDARDQVNAFLMAGVLGPGGFVGEDGVPELGELRSALAARLARASSAPRLSQRIVHRGRSLVWERCEPDLTWHVRAVGPVDGLVGLQHLCADLMTTPLAPGRPLWELLVVPGALASGPGIVLRVHHAVADGVAGVRLVQDLFGATPDAPAAVPGPARGSALPRWRAVATGVARVGAAFRRAVPSTVLLGPVGPQRGVAFCDVELLALERGARVAGGTVNDALLAAVVWAVESALRARGHPVPEVLPVSVPVALPDRGASGNAVGLMVVPLPTREPDLRARLGRIAPATRAAKSAARVAGTFELTRTRWGSLLFKTLARRQRLVALFVTNVRGPGERLAVAGSPLERAWPLTPLQGNVRVAVAAFSYAGRLGCAVHTDAAVIDAEVLGHVLSEELDGIAHLA